MEDQPTADDQRRTKPRARMPRAAFTPPDVPAGPEQPADQNDRRTSPSTIAPVLFQPPARDTPVTSPAVPEREISVVGDPAPAGKAPIKKAAVKKAAVKKAAVKKAPVRKTAPRQRAEPSGTPTDRPTPTPTPTPTVAMSGGARRTSGAPGAPRRVWTHLGYAPELLALAAVDRIGPAARDWADRLRTDYPAAEPDRLARLATRRYVRLAGLGGAVSPAAGLLAPVAELVTVVWSQAALVLHVAAAYGLDPTDPERAVELLTLTQIHPDDQVARSALAVACGTPGGEVPQAIPAVWRLAAPLAAQTGGWAVLRLAARALPGAAALARSAGNSLLTERLAARAIDRYRTRIPRPPTGTAG